MKKISLFIAMAILSLNTVFAQTPATTKAKQISKSTKSVVKASPVAGPTKKDGTADMRYKANKAAKAAPVAGPTKKDGTADMRYKANKTAKKTQK